ncbi:MAG: gamma-glutamyltransferase, partial [Chloroflexi bacterium]|nr:gamma-glutamyltransferase [Chloroflexota bacterium]
MQFFTRRPSVVARHGMVATSETQAAMAGLRVLMEGGNAVDAAVATSSVLCVTEPMSTGIGGDMFALIWSAKDRKVYALNGSGAAGEAASLQQLKEEGLKEIPIESAYAVTVPGIVDGWHAILKRHGSMSLSKLLRPAIDYARDGFVVQGVIARSWNANAAKLARYPSGSELLLNGRAPRPGEVMRLPELARTLKDISRGGPKAFYRGNTGRKIANYVQERGGWLDTSDLSSHRSTWDEPIST